MKCFILISMFFTWLSSHAFAQHDNLDTVYLKSGDVIQGIVFEIIPGESLKIRTEASHVITLDTASVLKILRRVSSEHYSSCIVHLKSGDIVEGLIHEIIPGESLKIQTQTGDVIPIERTTILKISIVDIPIVNKNPYARGFLSCLVPGAGQLYNKQYWKAIGFFGVFTVSVMAVSLVSVVWYFEEVGEEVGLVEEDREGLGGILVFWGFVYVSNVIISSVDAYTSAREINRNNRRKALIKSDDIHLVVEPYTSRGTYGAMLSFSF